MEQKGTLSITVSEFCTANRMRHAERNEKERGKKKERKGDDSMTPCMFK
jgi:hypothetical protein